jgi:hypothetical protein
MEQKLNKLGLKTIQMFHVKHLNGFLMNGFCINITFFIQNIGAGKQKNFQVQ